MTQAIGMDIDQHRPLVQVVTTHNRGQTPEEVAKRCVNRLIYVSDGAPKEIRDQAVAYRDHIEKVVALYMREAIASDRTTVYNALRDAGHPELALGQPDVSAGLLRGGGHPSLCKAGQAVTTGRRGLNLRPRLAGRQPGL